MQLYNIIFDWIALTYLSRVYLKIKNKKNPHMRLRTTYSDFMRHEEELLFLILKFYVYQN